MGGYEHYETINIEADFSAEKLEAIWNEHRKTAIEKFNRLSKDKTEEEKVKIWMFLTSRGANKCMFGEMPDCEESCEKDSK